MAKIYRQQNFSFLQLIFVFIALALILTLAYALNGFRLPPRVCYSQLPLASSVIIQVAVPQAHADKVREAMGAAGAGKVGKYSHGSFSYQGIGRFIPLSGSQPFIGAVGKLEAVEEVMIVAPCDMDILDQVIAAIKQAHPYEEPGIDIIPRYQFDHKAS